MAEPPEYWRTSYRPPDLPPVQLIVHIELITEEKGGCAARFWVSDELGRKYGGKALALEACRGYVVEAVDELIEIFRDEE